MAAVKVGNGADVALRDECDIVGECGRSRIIHGVVKRHNDDLANTRHHVSHIDLASLSWSTPNMITTTVLLHDGGHACCYLTNGGVPIIIVIFKQLHSDLSRLVCEELLFCRPTALDGGVPSPCPEQQDGNVCSRKVHNLVLCHSGIISERVPIQVHEGLTHCVVLGLVAPGAEQSSIGGIQPLVGGVAVEHPVL